jgi:hypothetical protein
MAKSFGNGAFRVSGYPQNPRWRVRMRRRMVDALIRSVTERPPFDEPMVMREAAKDIMERCVKQAAENMRKYIDQAVLGLLTKGAK